jgi:hypothetical protein
MKVRRYLHAVTVFNFKEWVYSIIVLDAVLRRNLPVERIWPYDGG